MLTDIQIETLARALACESDTNDSIDAGYTYLGQFISHDIVPETRRSQNSRAVAPFLSLQSVYGAPKRLLWGPDGQFHINAKDVNDLPRVPGADVDTAVAAIPEPRNDENVIIAQLHLLWHRLHNFIVLQGHTGAEAQQLVTRIYQMIVVEDYLRQILAPAVFHSYFRCNERWLGFDASAIPLEFTLAAFRFGHSMTRATYESKSFKGRATPVPLSELFRPNRPLSLDLVVVWSRFFGLPIAANGAQDSMAIDAKISKAMSQIPVPVPGRPPIDLIKVNLMNNNLSNLPSGRSYVEGLLSGANAAKLQSIFGLAPLNDLAPLQLQLPEKSEISINNLPLWPYILLEAKQASDGRRLGTLGSLICAEVFANAIEHAAYSIYPTGRHVPLDDLLFTLGDIGDQLCEVRRACSSKIEEEALRGRSATPNRPFCMRYIIELLEPGE